MPTLRTEHFGHLVWDFLVTLYVAFIHFQPFHLDLVLLYIQPCSQPFEFVHIINAIMSKPGINTIFSRISTISGFPSSRRTTLRYLLLLPLLWIQSMMVRGRRGKCLWRKVRAKASTMRTTNPARARKREKMSTTVRKRKKTSMRAGGRTSSSTSTSTTCPPTSERKEKTTGAKEKLYQGRL
jgi:hypothetical protein